MPKLCWRVEIMSMSEGEYGGYKEIIAKISGDGVYGRLKFESGDTAYSVFRRPVRIHYPPARRWSRRKPSCRLPTRRICALIRFVLPARAVSTYRLHRPAIRITHSADRHVVECRDERSQYKTKRKRSGRAFTPPKRQNASRPRQSTRRNLLGSGDRSDRNRPIISAGAVTDHRINLTLYRLDETMEGVDTRHLPSIVQNTSRPVSRLIRAGTMDFSTGCMRR